MPASPRKDDDVENCEELNDDYFETIGQTFSVVDEWDENQDAEIKKEPQEEDSNHSNSSDKKSKKTDSQSSKRYKNDSKFQDSRGSRATRTNSNSRSERNRTSQERNRLSQERRHISPIRRRISTDRRRISPEINRSPLPFRDNDRFRRSPPRQFDRRRPPSPVRNNRNPDGPSTSNRFLAELQENFAKQGVVDSGVEQFIRQGVKIDYKKVLNESEPQHNFQHRQRINSYNPNMPPYQNEQIMHQQYNPMIQQTPAINSMQFGLVPQMSFVNIPMAPKHFMNMENPRPIPPPLQIDPKPVPPPAPFRHPVIEQQPQPKKTTNESSVNLVEILRKKSKQNKSLPNDEKASKKAKVLERCKEAVNIITDLEQNKSKLPFTCILSENFQHKPKSTLNRSPLLTSDNNVQFLFQSTPQQCHSVLENHPLRNIYGTTAEIAQYLKFDLHELASNVDRETLLNHFQQVSENVDQPVVQEVVHQNVIVHKASTSTAGVQTDKLVCKNCNLREAVKQNAKSKACQTDTAENAKADADVQVNSIMPPEQEEIGSFKILIDAKTMDERNFEQHHALEVFTKAFNIPCPYIRSNSEHNDTDSVRYEREDLNNYSNPDNPHHNPENPNKQNFFSLSPIRITRRSQDRVRPDIFARIGEKVSDHSDSPIRYDDFHMNRKSRSPIRPYRIPSPRYTSYRSPSPGSSRRYRNRSRSRSRSLSRSPKRFKSGYKFLERRGRY